MSKEVEIHMPISNSHRGFEVISAFEDKDINLPVRATKNAAGYDFEAAEDIVIPSIWTRGVYQALKLTFAIGGHSDDIAEDDIKKLKPVLVPTGIKAYMKDNEYLQLCNRSSNPLKNYLILANGVGIIDSDYYDNEANEGHIMFQFLNFGLKAHTIKKGERIGQGIFVPFLTVDNEVEGKERTGGFGSSGQ